MPYGASCLLEDSWVLASRVLLCLVFHMWLEVGLHVPYLSCNPTYSVPFSKYDVSE